jgi:hypothetical protein
MCLLVLEFGITAAHSTGLAAYAAFISDWPSLVMKIVAVLVMPV